MIMKYSQFAALMMLVGTMGIGMASCKGASRTEKQSADSLVSVICPTEELSDGESAGTSDADENGNPTGGYTFPQPGLSDEGVVFSFQPYAISCFAAGTFHFTIPYGKILHLLTPDGRRCVEDV